MLPIGTATTAAGGAVLSVSLQTPQPRLVRAAHEFEAQMMKELLKPMTGGMG
jgi:HAMP domain-containing protein